jgi:hypothetical protein
MIAIPKIRQALCLCALIPFVVMVRASDLTEDVYTIIRIDGIPETGTVSISGHVYTKTYGQPSKSTILASAITTYGDGTYNENTYAVSPIRSGSNLGTLPTNFSPPATCSDFTAEVTGEPKYNITSVRAAAAAYMDASSNLIENAGGIVASLTTTLPPNPCFPSDAFTIAGTVTPFSFPHLFGTDFFSPPYGCPTGFQVATSSVTAITLKGHTETAMETAALCCQPGYVALNLNTYNMYCVSTFITHLYTAMASFAQTDPTLVYGAVSIINPTPDGFVSILDYPFQVRWQSTDVPAGAITGVSSSSSTSSSTANGSGGAKSAANRLRGSSTLVNGVLNVLLPMSAAIAVMVVALL